VRCGQREDEKRGKKYDGRLPGAHENLPYD